MSNFSPSQSSVTTVISMQSKCRSHKPDFKESLAAALRVRTETAIHGCYGGWGGWGGGVRGKGGLGKVVKTEKQVITHALSLCMSVFEIVDTWEHLTLSLSCLPRRHLENDQ